MHRSAAATCTSCTNSNKQLLTHRFHGKAPSKNKQETRLQKAAEEIARRKNATSEISQHGEMEGLRRVSRMKRAFISAAGCIATA